MHRKQILELLENHATFNEQEEQFRIETIQFVNENEQCFERELLKGHVTGSAWVLDKSRQYTLLTHHRKLDKWFQTGGHCDGDSDVLAVAIKEAEEETGLSAIKAISTAIFDVDVHLIPERKDVSEHYHYDIRFLLEADTNETLGISSESKDLAWVELSKVAQLNDSESIMRMVEKSANL